MPTRVRFLLCSEKHFPNEYNISAGIQKVLAAEDTVNGTVSRCQGWIQSETKEEVKAK